MSFHFRTGFMVDGHLLSLDLSQCLDIRYTEFRQKDGYGGHLATWQADAQVRKLKWMNSKANEITEFD